MSKKYFPEDYKNFKIIKKFVKPRAINARVFITNDPEEWFITILYYKRRSGEVKDTEIIIAEDLENWFRWFKNMGWEKNKD